MANDWIEWAAADNDCPVDNRSYVQIKRRDGVFHEDFAEELYWDECDEATIVAYRVIEVAYSVPDFVPNVIEDTTNPKAAAGAAKLPLNLWSPLATAYGSLGLLNGGKYGYGNYKATPVLASIYIAATERHFNAWKEGQECDPVDGVPHLAAVLANIAILLESRAVGKMVDDRQIQGGYLREVEKLTEIANNVKELHKHLTPKHYTIKDTPEDGKIT